MTRSPDTNPSVVGVIPARLASSRFPRKILASDTGKPLIQHVWEAAKRSRSLSRVVIAVDDQAVSDIVRSFGGEAVMTSLDHPNGTSRLAEAAKKLALTDDAIVVNVQGDEPEMDPAVIDAAVALARTTTAQVTTVASPFAIGEDPADPNVVKVVLRRDGTALYFSRSLIPHARVGAVNPTPPLKHIGLYAYRAGFLPKYLSLEPTPLEHTEMLEQLRVLEHGYSIAVAVRPVTTTGIDTPEQYAAFVFSMEVRRRALTPMTPQRRRKPYDFSMPVEVSKLDVQIYPAPVLRKKAEPIAKVTDEVRSVAARMIELMRDAKGIGLAAPQVGLSWRMFVVEIDPESKRAKSKDAEHATGTNGPEVYINPRFSNPVNTVEAGEEGCLSIPGVFGDVLRPPTITITATNLDGKEFTKTGTGLLARCWQHEYDHLDGVLILDRMIAAHRVRNRLTVRDLERDAVL